MVLRTVRQTRGKGVSGDAQRMKGTSRRELNANVARINWDGTDANAEQVRAGMAWAFTKYLTDPQIKAIEDEAQAQRRGAVG